MEGGKRAVENRDDTAPAVHSGAGGRAHRHPSLVAAEGCDLLGAAITCLCSKWNRAPGWELLEGTVDVIFLTAC